MNGFQRLEHQIGLRCFLKANVIAVTSRANRSTEPGKARTVAHNLKLRGTLKAKADSIARSRLWNDCGVKHEIGEPQ